MSINHKAKQSRRKNAKTFRLRQSLLFFFLLFVFVFVLVGIFLVFLEIFLLYDIYIYLACVLAIFCRSA